VEFSYEIYFIPRYLEFPEFLRPINGGTSVFGIAERGRFGGANKFSVYKGRRG